MKTNQKKFFFPLLSVALLALGMTSLGASDAFALTALKQVQVSNGSRVDLLFDGHVSRNQIRTEFLRNIVQISLNDVSVYPAKISSVSGGALTKIFAYQYSPKLVRVRLTVEGTAESYKNKVIVTTGGPGGKMLTIRLNGAEAAPARAEVSQATAAPMIRDADERALLEQVMKAKGGSVAPGTTAVKNTSTDTITEKSAAPIDTGIANTENRPVNLGGNHHGTRIGGASELPSPLSALGKLALVIGLFSLIALAVKKFWKPGAKNGEDTPLLGALGRFARNNLGAKALGKKMAVEVLANHHLGPKKSIAVIRVAGRTMVVGITEQAINLISQLSSEEDTLNALAELDNPPLDEVVKTPSAAGTGPDVFSKLLQNETVKPAVTSPVANTKLAATTVTTTVNTQPRRDVRVTSYGNSSAPTEGASGSVSAQAAMGLSGVRAQIRNKLEGLKQI